MPIIDAHAHIYPDKIAPRAVPAIGTFYLVPMQGEIERNPRARSAKLRVAR